MDIYNPFIYKTLQLESGSRIYCNKELNDYRYKVANSNKYKPIKKESYEHILYVVTSSHDDTEVEGETIYDSNCGVYRMLGTSNILRIVYEDYWSINNKKTALLSTILKDNPPIVIGYVLTDGCGKYASTRGIARAINKTLVYAHSDEALLALLYRGDTPTYRILKVIVKDGIMTPIN